MHLAFEVAETKAVFRRSRWTGRAQVHLDGSTLELDSPLRPSTHFSTSLEKVWRSQVGGHLVEIVKIRPLLFGGLRQSSYVVSVDGTVVAEATGV